MMDDIPSFASMDTPASSERTAPEEPAGDTEDSIDDFSLEQEQDGELPQKPVSEEYNELSDLPGLDDWLSQDHSEDHRLLDELEQADFDDLLGGLGDDEETQAGTSPVAPDTAADSEPASQEKPDMSLGNPDLDLEALLSDPQQSIDDDTEENDFLDVETLINDSDDDSAIDDDAPLDLDVSLSDFSGIGEDDDVIDIDKDAGQSANLDLARVYVEMDDFTAARELLNEVLEKGSEDQIEEAKTILAGLS